MSERQFQFSMMQFDSYYGERVNYNALYLHQKRLQPGVFL